MNKSKIKALPMVEFSKMEYKRPDIEKYEKDMTALFKEFDEAKTAKECIDVIDKVEQLSVTMNTLSSLVYLHYTIYLECMKLKIKLSHLQLWTT